MPNHVPLRLRLLILIRRSSSAFPPWPGRSISISTLVLAILIGGTWPRTGLAICDPCVPGTPCGNGGCLQCIYDPFFACYYCGGQYPDGNACASDGNPCTTDACLGGTCSHSAIVGASCNDGKSCTANDTCNASGNCVGSNTCDDSNPCTKDTCTTSGCVFSDQPDGTPCADNNTCTTGNTCLAGICGTCDYTTSCVGCGPSSCVPLIHACQCMPIKFCDGHPLTLQTHLYSFVAVQSGLIFPFTIDQGTSGNLRLIVLASGPSGLQTYIAIQAYDGRYVTAVGGGGGAATATATSVGPNETWLLTDYVHDNISLKAPNGQYLHDSGGLISADGVAEEPFTIAHCD